MKMRSVRYLSFEGIKNLWANRLMTVASVGVLVACMVIVGLAMLLTMNVNTAMSSLEQENVIMAYFNDKNSVLYGSDTQDYNSTNATSSDASSTSSDNLVNDENDVPEDAYLIHNDEEGKALCKELEKIPNVQSVEYISSEDGLKNLKENHFEDQEELFSFFDTYGNPLQAGARITLNNMNDFEKTLKEISNTTGVSATQSFSDLAKKIQAIKNGVSVAGVWIIGILLIISLVIVSNTIRVTMYTRKLEIGIMKAVGATNSFIRLPFVIEGIAIGIISSIISVGLIYLCYRIVGETIASSLGTLSVVSFRTAIWELLLTSLGIGVISGLLGSIIMIGKYLRKEGSEFSAI